MDEPRVAEPGETAAATADSPFWSGLRSRAADLADRLREVHPAAWLTLIGVAAFTAVFGALGVRQYESFGSWSFDMGIYDQGFWLVSRGGQSFVTVRGLEFWGHHLNLIALAYAPFYWLGAGPRFLYVSQAFALALAAVPIYLIARDRFMRPWLGFVFAAVYLMYAPIQWISWANFHPEALVVTPFLFAWWFATRESWRAFFVAVVIALSTREDTALAVVVLGLVLLVRHWRDGHRSTARAVAYATTALGIVWYVVATRLVIPHFNDGRPPFYIAYFYGNYGSTVPEVVQSILAHPDRVIGDATQPDRLRFYRDLALPLGGLPLLSPLTLAMAGPQLLASVIGLSPYARMIRYQYTAVMIAPIVISAIEGAWLVWRFKAARAFLVPWMLICSYVTNVAWSPSPLSDNDVVWARPTPRHETMRDAVEMVPDDASVTATYTLLPHLAHRERIFDWPNPFQPAYWGNDDPADPSDDRVRLPDPSTIEYLVVDRTQVGPGQTALFADLIAADGEYEVLLDRDGVVVARRRAG